LVRTSRRWPEPATLKGSYGIDRICWSGPDRPLLAFGQGHRGDWSGTVSAQQ
jgi:hypothetical protein